MHGKCCMWLWLINHWLMSPGPVATAQLWQRNTPSLDDLPKSSQNRKGGNVWLWFSNNNTKKRLSLGFFPLHHTFGTIASTTVTSWSHFLYVFPDFCKVLKGELHQSKRVYRCWGVFFTYCICEKSCIEPFVWEGAVWSLINVLKWRHLQSSAPTHADFS